MGSRRLKSSVIVAVVLCGGVYTCASKVSEHRADYPGRVTFVGRPRNIFGSTYTRAFMWRRATDTRPLPDVTVHVDGRAYKLSNLTPELMKELGGYAPEGRLTDAEYNTFVYRFEGGRLTGFSWESGGWADEPPPNQNAETLALSIGEGQPFVLPITHRELVRRAGRPKSTYLTSGQ